MTIGSLRTTCSALALGLVFSATLWLGSAPNPAFAQIDPIFDDIWLAIVSGNDDETVEISFYVEEHRSSFLRERSSRARCAISLTIRSREVSGDNDVGTFTQEVTQVLGPGDFLKFDHEISTSDPGIALLEVFSVKKRGRCDLFFYSRIKGSDDGVTRAANILNPNRLKRDRLTSD